MNLNFTLDTLNSGGNDHSLRFWNIEARSNTFTIYL